MRSKFVFRILVLISISYCAQACPFFQQGRVIEKRKVIENGEKYY